MSTCKAILSHEGPDLWAQDTSEAPKASLPAALGSLLPGKRWDKGKVKCRESRHFHKGTKAQRLGLQRQRQGAAGSQQGKLKGPAAFFLSFFRFLFYVYVLLACMHVYVPCACLVPQKSRRGIRSPGTVVKGGCKPMCVY